MSAVVVTDTEDETREIAARLAPSLEAGDVVVLSGELGSGKTVFAQGVIGALGVDDPVTSPTFALVHEYEARLPVAHVDVYRLNRVQELFDLGFEEIASEDRVTFVEWGERADQVLPADRLTVHIARGDEPDRRVVTLTPVGRRWERRLPVLVALVDDRGL